ncbi:hypothetical protein PT974_12252 [Cladobotryum mycophilum]|uniref:Uncharacterized protein n=1 Tax=Cladobotryum mycophilum TaxID=491253 RepID=A0ABR0S8F4_9HYPO
MPSQRPFFLSSFFASFRQQAPSLQATASQANKHTTQASPSVANTTSSTARAISTNAVSGAHSSATANMAIHSPRGSPGAPMNIPHSNASRRRGSDSSSEGFRDAIGADKWYIGGRTAAGEEKFFKLGVIRRVRSNDGLSLDRLSL